MSDNWWATPGKVQFVLREEIKIRDDRIEALTVRVEKAEAALKEAVGFLAEADRRIIWEGLGFGNDFADSVDAFLAKHGEQP
jgi:hypothetical protein